MISEVVRNNISLIFWFQKCFFQVLHMYISSDKTLVKYHLGLQLESLCFYLVDVNCKKSGLGPIWGNSPQGRKFLFPLILSINPLVKLFLFHCCLTCTSIPSSSMFHTQQPAMCFDVDLDPMIQNLGSYNLVDFR